MVKSLTPETQKALDKIMSTFSGADGGVSFALFRSWLKQADAEPTSANTELVLLVKRFGKLLSAIDIVAEYEMQSAGK